MLLAIIKADPLQNIIETMSKIEVNRIKYLHISKYVT